MVLELGPTTRRLRAPISGKYLRRNFLSYRPCSAQITRCSAGLQTQRPNLGGNKARFPQPYWPICFYLELFRGRTEPCYREYFFIRCRNERYEIPSRSAAFVCTPPL